MLTCRIFAIQTFNSAELIYILYYKLSTLSECLASFGFDALSFRSGPGFLGMLIGPTYMVETLDGAVGLSRIEEVLDGMLSTVGSVPLSLPFVLLDNLLGDEWLLM
jgi:hypothetical protein